MPTQTSPKTRSRTLTPPRTSRRSASAPLRPFTVDHFRAYARKLVLDNGERWDPEGFQLEIVEDLFADFVAVWTVIPEANGKTTLMGGVGLYWADFKAAAEVLLAAASRQQAELMYGQAAGFVRRTPGMRQRFRPYDGYRRIKSLRLEGRIQVMAADDATGDGVLYDLALIDEPHRQRNLKLYRTWYGKAQKRGGTIGMISTAGEPGSEFEDTRSKIRLIAEDVQVDGFHTRAVAGDTVLHDYMVPADCSVDDMAVVKAANPFSGITVELLRAKRDNPAMTVEHWRRFVCNQATSLEGNGIGPEEWDRLEDPKLAPDPKLRGFGWMDLAWEIDTAAVGVILWDGPERRLVPAPVILEPPVDEGDVVQAILDFEEQFPRLRGWVMDPSAGAKQMAQLLEKGTHPMQAERGIKPLSFKAFAHSQDNAPMSLAAVRLDEAVRNGWLVQSGCRKMRAHVLNAVRKSVGGEKYRFDRPPGAQGERRKRYPIDALTGLLMGHSTAVMFFDKPDRPKFEVVS